MINPVKRASAALAMPWNTFVAAFLYYVVLAVLALGGLSPAAPVVITAYLAPVLVYAAALMHRIARAAGRGFQELLDAAHIRGSHAHDQALKAAR